MLQQLALITFINRLSKLLMKARAWPHGSHQNALKYHYVIGQLQFSLHGYGQSSPTLQKEVTCPLPSSSEDTVQIFSEALGSLA